MAAAPAKGRHRDASEGAKCGVTYTIFAKYKKRILFVIFYKSEFHMTARILGPRFEVPRGRPESTSPKGSFGFCIFFDFFKNC